MVTFNLITKIIFFACLGWSVGLLVFYFIKRALVRKNAKKELLDNENERDNENREN